MLDIILEMLRAVFVGGLLAVLIRWHPTPELTKTKGWYFVLIGFGLTFFGTLIDITDNFEELTPFIIIGNTPIQAFLEKVVGYLAGSVLITIGISQWLPSIIEHQKMTESNLQRAESQLKILHGLLPMCAACKDIRDSNGNWQNLESYISHHSEAQFSHGICPDCSKRLYPEYSNH